MRSASFEEHGEGEHPTSWEHGTRPLTHGTPAHTGDRDVHEMPYSFLAAEKTLLGVHCRTRQLSRCGDAVSSEQAPPFLALAP